MNISNLNKNELDLLSNIYKYCVTVNWKQEKLEELSLILNIDAITIKNWARLFAKKSLTSEEYNNFIEKSERITIFELEKFKKIENDLKPNKHQVGRSTAKINPVIYKEKNKKIYRLWETEEEKELVLKYIYNICIENNYSDEILEKLTNVFGISSKDIILSAAKKYAINYLGYTEKEYAEKRIEYTKKKMEYHYKNRPNESKKFFEQLLTAKTLEDIIFIIEKSAYIPRNIQTSLGNYIIVQQQNNKEIEKQLREKIKLYSEYKSNQNKVARENIKNIKKEQLKEEKLKIAVECINSFIESDKYNTIEYFCKDNNISKENFMEYVELIKEKHQDLYFKYSEKTANIKKKNYIMINKQLLKLMEYLKNGIDDNGIIRPFDLIDYYIKIRLSLDNILIYAKNIVSPSQMAMLRRFVQQNISGIKSNYSELKMIMLENVEINMKKDKNGMPIAGTGEIFTNEQKEMIIEYLKKNNVPINRKTYTIAFKRYKDGFLNFEPIKNKKLVLKEE